MLQTCLHARLARHLVSSGESLVACRLPCRPSWVGIWWACALAVPWLDCGKPHSASLSRENARLSVYLISASSQRRLIILYPKDSMSAWSGFESKQTPMHTGSPLTFPASCHNLLDAAACSSMQHPASCHPIYFCSAPQLLADHIELFSRGRVCTSLLSLCRFSWTCR